MSAFDTGLGIAQQQDNQARLHKQRLSDEELASNIGQVNANIAGLQDKLKTVQPGSVDHAQAVQDLQSAIEQKQALFHPQNNPTAIQKFGHLFMTTIHPGSGQHAVTPIASPTISQAPAMTLPGGTTSPVNIPALPGYTQTQPAPNPDIGIRYPDGHVEVRGNTEVKVPASPAQTLPGMPVQGPTLPAGPAVTVQGPQTPAAMKAQAEANLIARSTPTPDQMNPYLVEDRQMQAAGYSPEEIQRAKEIKAGVIAKPITFRPVMRNYLLPDGTVQSFNSLDPNNIPDGATEVALPSSTHKTVHVTQAERMRESYAASLGKTPEQLTMEDNANYPQWLDTFKNTSGTHQTIQYDAQGNPQLVTLTNTSKKGPGGGGSSPKMSASNKGSSGATGGGSTPQTGGGQLNFRRATPQSTAAFKAKDVAQKSLADVQSADDDKTPVGDKGIIMAWLRGKVNRVTQSEINTVNNLGGAKMKLEGNVANIVSGTMTQQQRDWFKQDAQHNFDNAQKIADQYGNPQTPGSLKKKAKDINSPGMSDDEFLMKVKVKG